MEIRAIVKDQDDSGFVRIRPKDHSEERNHEQSVAGCISRERREAMRPPFQRSQNRQPFPSAPRRNDFSLSFANPEFPGKGLMQHVRRVNEENDRGFGSCGEFLQFPKQSSVLLLKKPVVSLDSLERERCRKHS